MVPRAKPATLGMVSYMVPVVATMAGWWWLNEALTSLQWSGMAIIVLGVAIVTWPSRARQGRERS
jgi:drug/metabolite transporter (DMT)-like permease